MTAKPVPEHISDERLAEMLAAAEKATPGPWEARTQAEWTTGYDFFAGKDGAFCFPVDLEAEDAAHINNCDPASITAALTELQHRREAEAGILAQDVIDLVIAARMVVYEDQSPEAIRALDNAVEAFAERVGWENDPDDEALSALGEHP
jgi:hypothetical protein